MIVIILFFLFWVLYFAGIVKLIKWVGKGPFKKTTDFEKMCAVGMIMKRKK